MLGTELMSSMLERELLTGGDGVFDPSAVRRRPAVGARVRPGLQADAARHRGAPGVRDRLSTLPRRRPLIRYCVDWSEQRHHLAGALGAAIAERMFELEWIHRARTGRAVHISDEGYAGLRATFGIELNAA